jgi:hypothetical protein
MKNAASLQGERRLLFPHIEMAAMTEPFLFRNAPSRPALTALIGAMEKLPRCQRNEVARVGRKARAAKEPRIRRLTWEAVAESRRLAREAAP